MRRRQRVARPGGELVGIVVEPIWRAPVGHDGALAALRPLGRVGERPLPFGFERRDGLLIGLQVERVARHQGEHGAVGKDAEAREHAARYHRAERRKQLDDAIGVHADAPAGGQCVSAVSPEAGVSATDSPQPQAEVWFGLLNTKPADSLSILKSISVPSRNITALGSISSLTPLSSTTSSCGCALSAYSIV